MPAKYAEVILPLPLKGVKEDSIPVGVPMYWSINKDESDEEKAAAKEFLNWIVYSDNGQKMLVETAAVIPACGNNAYDS